LAKKLTKKARSNARSRHGAVAVRGAKTGALTAASKVGASVKAIRALKAKLAAAQARIDELQAWADTDFLLNIYNRRGFERELARSIAYIKRYAATGALIVLDVDRLKPVNDKFGHAAGDVVLKGVVAVLMRHLRSSDLVGRLGGDEFGLLLWNLTEADALTKAKALEDAIDRLTFVFKGNAVTAGASAGIALLGPMDDAATALAQADRAMYQRKEIRRGSVTEKVRR
jgi:diguanylate cyclase (GGDEF)-like protein